MLIPVANININTDSMVNQKNVRIGNTIMYSIM